jgi:hypothetical protein
MGKVFDFVIGAVHAAAVVVFLLSILYVVARAYW